MFGILDPARLPGCTAQGFVGQVPKVLGPGPAAEMLERRREPRLSWHCKAPPSETSLRSEPVRVAVQAPGACGPGLQGAWGPGPQGLGPGPAGFFPTPSHKLRFFKAWVSAETAASEVGTWRETKKRVFTFSAFGNHPTRPPRSADTRCQTPNPEPLTPNPTS